MALLNEKQFSFISAAPGFAEDTFAVVSFRGFEAISKPYEFDILLVSENPEIDLDQMIQKPARFIIHREDSHDVQYHGILRQFEQLREAKGCVFYRALLSPKLWWLSLTHHNQVCLEESVSTIMEKVLLDGGLTVFDFEFRLQGVYPDIDYVCQFGESHFDFISRWMEREGIYYYFEQTDTGEKAIFTDSRVSHTDLPLGANLMYSPPAGLENSHRSEVIQSFTCRQRQLPQKVLLRDYNYEKPSLEISGSAPIDPLGRGKAYIYGEHFSSPEEGSRLAAIRAEELLCRGREFFGESTVPYLMTGFTFTMNDHYRPGFNQKYLITEITHEGSQTGYLTSGIAEVLSPRENRVFYHNNFTVIPATAQFRPERKTEKPRIAGTMHARIDAEGSGDYAELDEQGRYKVRLPFDIDTTHGAGKASHFVRMAQPYSGMDYGVHFPLHKGAEVLLTFIDGDPDRPVIAGAVPNPETASPITSENQAKSIFRDSYGNELIFDSTSGDEHIRLYSPHHDSLLQLGKSVVSQTESDGYEWKGGNTVELGAGNKFSAYAGNTTEVKAGMAGSFSFGLGYEAQAAGKHSLLFGYEAGLNLGPEFKYRVGASVDKGTADKSNVSEEDNIVSAKKVLNLVGGAKSVAGTSSIGYLNENEITFSIGINKNPDSSNTSKLVIGTLIATPIISTVLAAALTGALVYSLTIPEEDKRSAAIIPVSTAEGIVILLNIVIMAILGMVGLKDSISPVSHFDDPTDRVDAFLQLEKSTGIKIETRDGPAGSQVTNAQMKITLDGPISINSKPAAADKNKITIGIGDLTAADDAQEARILLNKSVPNIELRSGKSNMSFKKNGDITIDAKGGDKIQALAKGDISLVSDTGDLVLNAKSVFAKKGIFESKNIKDMG